jgi:O-antigen/teichoic acid export membrane protein
VEPKYLADKPCDSVQESVPTASHGLSLKRNFAWTLAGNLVFGASQWGVLMVLAKLGSPEVVGRFALGLAICTPVMLLFNMQLRSVQATDAKQEYAFGHYLGLRLLTSGLALVVILGISLNGGYLLETSLVILIVGLSKATDSLSDVCYGQIQFHERLDRIAISMMLRGTFALGIIISLFSLYRNLPLAVLGMVLVGVTVLLIYDIHSVHLVLQCNPEASGKTVLFRPLRPRYSLSQQASLVWLALPLGLVSLLISLNSNIPRYFIEWHLGERELGIYSAMAQFMLAGVMIVMALGHSASPRLARYYSNSDIPAYRTLLFKMVGVGAAVGALGVIGAYAIGEEILTLCYRPEYAQYPNVFVGLMVASALAYAASFLWYGITAARYFRIQIPLTVLTVIVCTLASFWLIPSHGLWGAAVALIMSQAVNVGVYSAVILYAMKVGGNKSHA